MKRCPTIPVRSCGGTGWATVVMVCLLGGLGFVRAFHFATKLFCCKTRVPGRMRSMDTATEFGRLLGPLRRAVLRTRHTAGLPELPEAQSELLRVLAEGDATPREVAPRLRVAPSTVSNLVRTMSAAGLVERSEEHT